MLPWKVTTSSNNIVGIICLSNYCASLSVWHLNIPATQNFISMYHFAIILILLNCFYMYTNNVTAISKWNRFMIIGTFLWRINAELLTLSWSVSVGPVVSGWSPAHPPWTHNIQNGYMYGSMLVQWLVTYMHPSACTFWEYIPFFPVPCPIHPTWEFPSEAHGILPLQPSFPIIVMVISMETSLWSVGVSLTQTGADMALCRRRPTPG